MKSGIQYPIARVTPLPGYRLRVEWEAGGASIVDFSSDVRDGPVWRPMRDEAVFSKVHVTDRGRMIAWPEPRDRFGPMVEVDGDGLWHMAREQEARNVARAAE